MLLCWWTNEDELWRNKVLTFDTDYGIDVYCNPKKAERIQDKVREIYRTNKQKPYENDESFTVDLKTSSWIDKLGGDEFDEEFLKSCRIYYIE